MLKIKSLYVMPTLLGGLVLVQKIMGSDLISGNGEILGNELLIKTYLNNSKKLKGIEEKIDEYGIATVRKLERKDAVKSIKRIKDYSVKISNKCGSGTGWFLDHEMPKDKRYPTKWFIATNAHVINSYYFDENPYKQTLPVWSSLFGFSQPRCNSGEITLFKSEKDGYEEFILNSSGIDSTDPKNWSNPYLKLFINYDKAAKNANHTEEQWELYKDINIMYSKLRNPKLFYVPLNFLGKKWRTNFAGLGVNASDYYKDFAVLEVNFQSEREAKRITGNLYERKEEDRLNFFGEELLAKKNGNELRKNRDNYFSAGYPGNSYNEYKPFGNYSWMLNRASNLSNWFGDFSLKNKHNQMLMGHVNSEMIDNKIPSMRLSWGGRRYKSWGYNYSLDNMKMGPGASGSLVTNEDGEVLGLYRAHDSSNYFGFVEPLRSEGYILNSKIILPRYDLITGVPGQVNSYRQQLEKYLPNIDTYLKRKWESSGIMKLS